jgi:hypothetical protein
MCPALSRWCLTSRCCRDRAAGPLVVMPRGCPRTALGRVRPCSLQRWRENRFHRVNRFHGQQCHRARSVHLGRHLRVRRRAATGTPGRSGRATVPQLRRRGRWCRQCSKCRQCDRHRRRPPRMHRSKGSQDGHPTCRHMRRAAMRHRCRKSNRQPMATHARSSLIQGAARRVRRRHHRRLHTGRSSRSRRLPRPSPRHPRLRPSLRLPALMHHRSNLWSHRLCQSRHAAKAPMPNPAPDPPVMPIPAHQRCARHSPDTRSASAEGLAHAAGAWCTGRATGGLSA